MKPLLVLGPITKDTNFFKDKKVEKIGGANYYQSIVFEKLKIPYKMYLTLSYNDKYLLNEMPNNENIIPIFCNETLTFTNKYDNDGFREQFSNFAENPIKITDIDLEESYSGIVLNPLVKGDFSIKTVKKLSKLNIPIFLSIQGLLRHKLANNSVDLVYNSNILNFLNLSNTLFLDTLEAKVLSNGKVDNIFNDFSKYNLDEIIITKERKGSTVYSYICNKTFNINAYKINNINYPTGAGDTYMASYISKRLNCEDIKKCGDFASKISSIKIEKGL